MPLSLGEDRGQESYPTGCVKRRGRARARRLRFKDGYGGIRPAAPAPAGLCPGAAAGAVCGTGPDAEALRLEEEEGPSRAASRKEDDDHHHDDDGAEPLIAAWSVIRKGRSLWLRPFALRAAQAKCARYWATKSQPTRSE